MGKITGKESGVIIGSVFGASAAIVSCLILILGMAKLLLQEKLGQGSTDIFISVVLLVSSVLGNWLSIKSNQKNKLPASIATTVMIASAMVIVGLTIDGKFENVLLRLGAVIAGCVISCLLCLNKSSNSKRIKKHYR